MDEPDFQHLDSDVLRLTRIKSRQLAGSYGFALHEVEDIQHDLLLDYLKRLPHFKAHRCNRRTFARLVVRNRVSTLIAERSAYCRGFRACHLSIDLPLDSQCLSPWQIGAVASALIDPRACVPSEDNLTLRLDVERILVGLSDPLRSLCRLLIACESYSEVAVKAGISRATLYRKLHALRAAFIQAGMHN